MKESWNNEIFCKFEDTFTIDEIISNLSYKKNIVEITHIDLESNDLICDYFDLDYIAFSGKSHEILVENLYILQKFSCTIYKKAIARKLYSESYKEVLVIACFGLKYYVGIPIYQKSIFEVNETLKKICRANRPYLDAVNILKETFYNVDIIIFGYGQKENLFTLEREIKQILNRNILMEVAIAGRVQHKSNSFFN